MKVFNIIDVYHDLSTMFAVMILAGIAYVAFQVADHAIMIVALAMIGILAGFFVWNYLLDLIFLSGGGGDLF